MIRAASMRRCLQVVLGVLVLASAWWWLRQSVVAARADVVSGPAREHAAPVPGSATHSDAASHRAKEGVQAAGQDTEPREDPAVLACAEDLSKALQVRAEELAASADAHDLAVSARLVMFIPVDSQRRQLQLLEKAAARDPDDAWIAGLYLQSCSQPGCDEQAALTRLLRIDPDNALVWLAATDRALRRKDVLEAERLLQRAATSSRVDIYHGIGSRAMFERIRTVRASRCTPDLLPAMTGDASASATMDDVLAGHATILANLQVPAFISLHELCRPDTPMPASRLSACRALYGRLADGRELALQMHGIRGMERLATTAAERTRWRERRRELMWLSENMQGHWTGKHLPLVWEYGEVPALIGALDAAGLWPPPPDWQPPREW